MTDGMLNDILEIERRIEQELADEQTRVDAWLERQIAEIDRWAEAEFRAKQDEACRHVEIRCGAARSEAARKIVAMRRHLRRLKALPEETLRRAIRQRLPPVLGGEGHDHQDEQG